MSIDENKRVSRRIFTDILNQGNLAVAGELVADDYLLHEAPPGLPAGIQGFQAIVMMYRTGFPDIHIAVEDSIAEGDREALRWSGIGTRTGASLWGSRPRVARSG